jgi:hypothetical protein
MELILITPSSITILCPNWEIKTKYNKVFLKEGTYQTFEIILSPIPGKNTFNELFPCGM